MTRRVLGLLLVPLAMAAAAGGARYTAAAGAAKAPPRLDYALTTIGRFDAPVHVTAPPGDARRLFVVEKKGTIRVLLDGRVLPAPFLDITALVESTGNEEGLLSLAFPAGYAKSGLLYVYYVDRDENARLVEYRRSRADPNRADPGSGREILLVRLPSGEHYGGLLLFGPDRRLYLGIGDGGLNRLKDQMRAQRDGEVHGKLLTVNTRTGATRIVARGLRNPWRYWFDRETGDLYVGDVGEFVRESIEHVPAGRVQGANFGWPCFEGTLARPVYPAALCPGAVPPLYEYAREGGNCSVIGGIVVHDPRLPALAGRYIYSDLCLGELLTLTVRKGKLAGRSSLHLYRPTVTSFGEDARRRVYVATLRGPVYRLDPRARPSGEAQPATGRELFLASGCGTCHTLASAGTAGTYGPNLDEAAPTRALVSDRVTAGKGAMPSFKGRLGVAEIRRLADFVAGAGR